MTPTKTIFATLLSTYKSRLAGKVDSVVRFDGTVAEAVAGHFANVRGRKVSVFVGFREDVPDIISGIGQPIIADLSVDVVVVEHGGPRSKNGQTYDRFDDTCDAVHLALWQESPQVLWQGGIQRVEQVSVSPAPLTGDYNSRAYRFQITRAEAGTGG